MSKYLPQKTKGGLNRQKIQALVISKPGISTTELYSICKEKLNILTTKTVDKHLIRLENDGMIIKKSAPSNAKSKYNFYPTPTALDRRFKDGSIIRDYNQFRIHQLMSRLPPIKQNSDSEKEGNDKFGFMTKFDMDSFVTAVEDQLLQEETGIKLTSINNTIECWSQEFQQELFRLFITSCLTGRYLKIQKWDNKKGKLDDKGGIVFYQNGKLEERIDGDLNIIDTWDDKDYIQIIKPIINLIKYAIINYEADFLKSRSDVKEYIKEYIIDFNYWLERRDIVKRKLEK